MPIWFIVIFCIIMTFIIAIEAMCFVYVGTKGNPYCVFIIIGALIFNAALIELVHYAFTKTWI